MRLAFFNWRDIRHPAAGGAEVYVHQVMKRLAERDHQVSLFCSSFKGSKSEEMIDGVRHVRYGGRFLMYPKSFLCYKKHIEGRFDIIIESINGMPFFTPLFAKEKTVAFIHQLTRENWYSGLPLPLAFIGYHSEDLMLSAYAKGKSIAPSGSTKSDLEKLGFADVEVVYGAADVVAPSDSIKAEKPTLIYLGRLARSKRVDHALEAFALIIKDHPGAILKIAGSGPDEPRLKALCKRLGLESGVSFLGKVDETKKARLLSESHLMLLPAVREGWGLVVLEANACGTPVIGYDIPGLRDSIKEGVSGHLVPDGDIRALAEKASHLLQNRKVLEALSESSKKYAEGFSWDKTADRFESILGSLAKGGAD
jgi:glycosyltransferase involved in cell wall biosynthesis